MLPSLRETPKVSVSASEASLSYFDGGRRTFAVRGVSLEIPATGFYGIMGPSGSGKSSLLYLLSGLKTPTSGSILYQQRVLSSLSEAERVRVRRNEFGFVFQQSFLLNYLTARENVLVAAPRGDGTATDRVGTLLRDLGIAHLAQRYPAHLSGGERQRLVVARAMINMPSVIFADEPTAALDHSNGRAVIDLLLNYRGSGAVVVVTHDPSMLLDADRVYHLLDGALEGSGDSRGVAK